jgi:4'-phosphopantetheinyl transferase EntD
LLFQEDRKEAKKKKKRKNSFLAGRPAAAGLQHLDVWGCYVL